MRREHNPAPRHQRLPAYLGYHKAFLLGGILNALYIYYSVSPDSSNGVNVPGVLRLIAACLTIAVVREWTSYETVPLTNIEIAGIFAGASCSGSLYRTYNAFEAATGSP